jgi:hypothetical protein
MTNDNDSVATLRLLAKCGSMDLSMLGPIADEMEQFHAAVKTAQELAATRLQEIERQKAALVEAWNETHTASIEIERLSNIANGCPVCAELAANIKPAIEPFEQLPAQLAWGLESKLPGGDWKVYWALYSDRARAEQAAKNGRPEGTEWRVVTYARMPEGASRDASSPCPSVHDHMWSGAGPEAYCLRCRTVRTGPADLVGALQDVVHTDPGPVRAAAAVKSIECPQCFGNKQIAMSDWTSRTCEYCGGTGRATLRTGE